MKLTRWHSQDGIPGFSNILENFFGKDITSSFEKTYEGNIPSVNIIEAQNNYVIEVAAPGLKKQDFKVRTQHNLITIETSDQTEREESKVNYTRREFSYHSFQRSFTLPDNVEAEKIEAKYTDGVLTISIPKKQEYISRAVAKEIDIM